MHRQRYAPSWKVLHTQPELRGVPRDNCFSVLQKSGLPAHELDHIWRLVAQHGDNMLSLEEFSLAMHLTNARVKAGITLPDTLPPALLPHHP